MSEIFWNGRYWNLSALAVPAFFIFTGLEFIAAKRRNKSNIFAFESSVVNISIGIAERSLSLLLAASFYNVFKYVYENFAIWEIPNHWSVWVLLILTTDLVWYWYHRLGHEINVLWAAHVVHHQSEEFNYTTSARITVIQSVLRNGFWCVLPLAGFHPDMVLVTLLIHGTYSFFTHTQIIRNLGWFEYIFVTPSHHRVHHGSNDKYLNKNYGDLFIFWDKMFGTYQKEEEEVVYGLTHPLKSYSFIWVHFHYIMELGYAASKTPGFINKIKLIFGRPEMVDQRIRNILERKYLPHKTHGQRTLRPHRIYLIIQLAICAVVTFVITLLYRDLSQTDLLAAFLVLAFTLVNCGALLEQRRWIYYLEYFRILTIAGYASLVTGNDLIFLLSFLVTTVAFVSLQKWYFRLVYTIH